MVRQSQKRKKRTETGQLNGTKSGEKPSSTVVWPHGRRTWPEITIDTILGISRITLQGHEGQENDQPRKRSMRSRGKTRLPQILVSEASHLIWVMRWKRTIHQKNHTTREIRSRWIKVINRRLTTDKITTTVTEIKRQDLHQNYRCNMETNA